MSQPPKHCAHCGGIVPVWDDIAEAMESFIEVAPNGTKPVLRQAIDEIRKLRSDNAQLSELAAYPDNPLSRDILRDAMRYRRLRCNWVRCDELNIDGRTVVIDRVIDGWIKNGPIPP